MIVVCMERENSIMKYKTSRECCGLSLATIEHTERIHWKHGNSSNQWKMMMIGEPSANLERGFT